MTLLPNSSLAAVAAGVVVTESDGSTNLDELGPTSDSYTVVLTRQPTDDVAITVTTDAQQTVSASQLTFTTSDWDTPQTVTVTAVDDGEIECSHTGLITHAAGSNDMDYHGIAIASVTTHLTDNCDRIEGFTPTEQSINVSTYRFPTDHSANAAILARNDLMIDAFTGIPFASVWHAPLLLTTPTQLDGMISDELERVLKSKSNPIYILGREEAVTPAVYDQLRIDGFTTLIQVGGEERFETAARIAQNIIIKQGNVRRAFITEDLKLVDSLGAGAAAGLLSDDGLVDPILLNHRGSPAIDPSTDAIIKRHPSITALELIGGNVALPLSLNQTYTERYPQLESVWRSGGDDRFDTNALIAERFFSTPLGVVIANGEHIGIPGSVNVLAAQSGPLFAALLAGTVAADLGYPLLIVRVNSVPAPIITYLIDHKSTFDYLIMVGSTSQVTQAVEDLVKSFI